MLLWEKMLFRYYWLPFVSCLALTNGSGWWVHQVLEQDFGDLATFDYKRHMEPLTCDEDVDRGVFVLLVCIAAAVGARMLG